MKDETLEVSKEDYGLALGQLEEKRKQKKEAKKANIYATRIFYENFNAPERIIINRGGAGSSKSYSLAQVFIQKFLTEKNKKFIILRKSLPFLRVSVYLTMKQVLETFGASDIIKEEKVGFNWIYGKNFLHFGSIDDPEKMKSSDWNYIWMEEATEFSYEEYNLIVLRLRAPTSDGHPNQLFMSFNPIDESHWIKTKLIDPGKVKNLKEIHSTFTDNPFIDPVYREELIDLINRDQNYHRVYGLGEWGRLENLIYSNWDIVDNIPQIDDLDICYGLDFGYNAPSAIIRLYIKGKDVWEEQLLYKNGLTNKDLIHQMQILIPPEHQRRYKIYADSASPDKIEEIRGAGFLTIRPAQKNIQDGIDAVKRMRCHILASSIDLVREKRAYSWKVDKKTSMLIDEPVDVLNHLMDAERYAIHTHLKNANEVKVYWL